MVLANRYEILEQLGGGGMAIVFKGRDTLLNRLVTIKVLRPEYTSDSEFVVRFRREAQAVASLSHPNIVSIYDVGQQDSIQFLVMEYVDGENLKTMIKRLGLLPAGQALSIAVQIAEALEHAHENNIVHRDVKPHNILITRLGKAKLTDFGIAMESQTGTVSNSGTVMGSVHYLSPEQARGEVAGPKSDIYSLGVVLYEMLSGTVPFTAETSVGVVLKHIQETPLPVTAVNADVPPGLAAVTDRAMRKDPSLRYASAREMAQDLTGSLQERAGPVEETIIIPDNLLPTRSGGKTVKKKRRISPAAWIILFLVLAGVIGGAAYFLRNYLNVPEVQVPDVTGKTYDAASAVMQGVGLATQRETGFNPSVPKDLVISQDPVAGALVKSGRTVTLTVSQGPELVSVPDLTGMTSSNAGTVLVQAGLIMDTVYQASATVPQGQVMGQTPSAGSSVAKGDHVTVDVSQSAQASVAVPNLTGMTMDQVTQKLSSLNLTLDQSNVGYVASNQYLYGYVVSQSPPPDDAVNAGTPVQVTLSSGPGPTVQDAQINVQVPADGKTHLLKITVQDARGLTDDYINTEPSGASVSRLVSYYGSATISVYVDGTLVGQQTY